MSSSKIPGSASLFNLPNKLTSLRLGLAFVLFLLIWLQQWELGLLVFVLAAFTDWLDGYYARKRGLISSLGRVYDPLVDKVLICGAFIFLIPVHGAGINAWMVTIIVAREFIVTGLRGFLEEEGLSFGADWLGKTKMFLQCGTIIWILLFLSLFSPEPSGSDWRHLAELVRDTLNLATVAVTFISGAHYVYRAIGHLK